MKLNLRIISIFVILSITGMVLGSVSAAPVLDDDCSVAIGGEKSISTLDINFDPSNPYFPPINPIAPPYPYPGYNPDVVLQ